MRVSRKKWEAPHMITISYLLVCLGRYEYKPMRPKSPFIHNPKVFLDTIKKIYMKLNEIK